MQNTPSNLAELIEQAKQAILQGDLIRARSLAEQVLAQDANNSAALLILAGVSAPQESLGYIKRVLDLDPQNPTARQAMHWVSQQLRESSAANWQPEAAAKPIPLGPPPLDASSLTRHKPNLLIPLLILVACLLVLQLSSMGAFLSPAAKAGQQFARYDFSGLIKPSLTPTNTPTPLKRPLRLQRLPLPQRQPKLQPRPRPLHTHLPSSRR